MDFAEQVYRATKGLPVEERFGLQQQLRRSAVSVASNVAEGHGRTARREYAYFVSIARGSLKEAETQLRLAVRLGFLTTDAFDELNVNLVRLNQLLTALRQRLRGSP